MEKICRLEITHRKMLYFYAHKSGKLAMAAAKHKPVIYTAVGLVVQGSFLSLFIWIIMWKSTRFLSLSS